MKIAIIGSGAVGILTAFHFDQLGADVVLFQRAPLGGNLLFIKEHFPNLKIHYQDKAWSQEEFFNEVIVPAGTELEKFELTKSGDVLRVHKRFVHPSETIINRTRMHDLFRVIYATNPKENILKQLEENPEMFEKLGPEVIESLHRPVESFADFDIVIDASGLGNEAHPMGAGLSLALNEDNLKNCGMIFYEKEIFENFKLENQKSITVIGEDITTKLTLLKLKAWLLADKTREVHWVTYKNKDAGNKPFGLEQDLEDFFKVLKADFEKEKEVFENKLRSWRDLEDYEKAKIPKPVEPKAQVLVYEGYDVTSVDRLLDREGLYITLESPSFRPQSLKVNDIITLSTEAVLVGRGVKKKFGSHSALISNEPGFYQIELTHLNDLDQQLETIQNDVLKYFAKA